MATVPPNAAINSSREFQDDDVGYLNWIARNPRGYVLNVRHHPDPEYVVLHSASCRSISMPRQIAGAYTARGYRKIAATGIGGLREAARTEGRTDGSFSKICSLCNPLEPSSARRKFLLRSEMKKRIGGALASPVNLGSNEDD